MSKVFLIEGSDLASRRSAVVLRQEVNASLEEGGATLDFSHVLNVSESYADELFGVLVEQHSLEWVFSRLNVRNAKPAILNTISSAIRYRLLTRLSPSKDAAVDAAQHAVMVRERRLAHA